jgi:oligopeptide transport system substrate-binding protein
VVDGPLTYVWSAPPPPPNRRRPLVVVCLAALTVVLTLAAAFALVHPSTTSSSGGSVTIFGPEASSLDPASQADAGSAQVVAQLFESLTAVDASGRVQPALADSWLTSNDGKRIEFHLRAGLTYSDGSAITAADVVFSWLRVLDPAHPSQLGSLLDDVAGARAYREGSGPKSAVGLSAVGADRIRVDLVNPASDFPAIVSGPTLAVVPPAIDTDGSILSASGFVGSGAYTLTALTASETTLTANARYWAGAPAIETIHLLSSIGGKSPVDEFEAGHLDYTPISVFDASWIASDSTLGPDLRVEPSPAVEFYGFNTTRPPFDNVHVRRAFQMGIDWRRLVQLQGDPLLKPATGMVPPAVPGHSATDFGPVFNLDKARSELTAAGYPGGTGFPKVSLITGGAALDEAIVRQLKDNLGIVLDYEAMGGSSYYDRLLSDPPAFWEMDWVADYPGADDFLGLLLGSGKTNNFGRWSSSDFDAAVGQALAGASAADVQQGFDRAQAVVLDQAPVIPVDYGAGYSLSSPRLLGAVPNGEGLIRYAGLAWGSGS